MCSQFIPYWCTEARENTRMNEGKIKKHILSSTALVQQEALGSMSKKNLCTPKKVNAIENCCVAFHCKNILK